MGWNTPGYTQDFETLPKNQESFRIPSTKLYFTFLGKLWQRCPMHAPHALLFPPQAIFSPPVLLCAVWVLISTCWAKIGVCCVCPGHLKGICDRAVELGRKLCPFFSFAAFFTSTVLQDVWHIFPRLINLLVVCLERLTIIALSNLALN